MARLIQPPVRPLDRDGRHFGPQRLQALIWRRGADATCFGHQFGNEGIGNHVRLQLFDHGGFDDLPADASAFAGEPIAAVSVPVPGFAFRCQQQAREQVVGFRAVVFRASLFHVRKDALGFFGADQALVRVVLDYPFRAWPALGAAFVATARQSLGMNVPDGVPGIGESIDPQLECLWSIEIRHLQVRRQELSWWLFLLASFSSIPRHYWFSGGSVRCCASCGEQVDSSFFSGNPERSVIGGNRQLQAQGKFQIGGVVGGQIVGQRKR